MALLLAIALVSPQSASATTYAFKANQLVNGSMSSASNTNPFDVWYAGTDHFTWYFSTSGSASPGVRSMTDGSGWLTHPNQGWEPATPVAFTTFDITGFSADSSSPGWVASGFDVRNTGASSVTITVTSYPSGTSGTSSTEMFTVSPGTQTISLAGHGPLGRTAGLVRVTFPQTIDLSFNNVQLSAYVAPVAPSVTTASVSDVTASSATAGGDVTATGGATVTARGVCWSTSANPTTADSKTTDGAGTGSFTSSISGLAPATTYHVRAYATNSTGTSYGSDVTFTTAAAPVVVSTPASSSWSLVLLAIIGLTGLGVLSRRATA